MGWGSRFVNTVCSAFGVVGEKGQGRNDLLIAFSSFVVVGKKGKEGRIFLTLLVLLLWVLERKDKEGARFVNTVFSSFVVVGEKGQGGHDLLTPLFLLLWWLERKGKGEHI